MSSFKNLQINLTAQGYNAGTIDGLMGPRTMTALMAYVGDLKPSMAARYANVSVAAGQLVKILAPYDLTTPRRIAHFLAQIAHESGGFKYIFELWGPSEAQVRYEGRADLGNVEKGDGFRYRGRGWIQLTGRANYAAYGAALKMPLEDNPDLAAQPDTAMVLACHYWHKRDLNKWADADNIARITKLINGGTNGLADRKERLAKIKNVWGME